MKRNVIILIQFLLILPFILSACAEKTQTPELSKCINIGNSLEAPRDVPWDVPMNIEYFSLIKAAGFQCVRLPVRFSDYVDASSSDDTLDKTFMKQIDSYISEALDQHLTIILDLHHFTEIMEDPAGNQNRLIAIWEQLARRYRDYPETLVFEILNEPQKNLDSDTWNNILAETVKAIRKIDDRHFLIVGGSEYYSIDSLSSLKLPDDDRLIVSIHYYEPNEVTFQGNVYHPGFADLHDIRWEGTSEQTAYLKSRLQTAKSWAEEHGVPLFIGEFGISRTAPPETRTSWIRAVASTADELGIDWGYWELASGFGIFDLNTGTWDIELLNALINDPSKQ